MTARKNDVALTAEERERLERVARSNKASIRERKRARILLLCDRSQAGFVPYDTEVARQVGVCTMTAARVRERFLERGLDGALSHKEQERRKARLIDGAAEAHLIATVCGAPPDGHKRWSLRLLKDKAIEGGYVDSVSHETVRQVLKKTNLNPG